MKVYIVQQSFRDEFSEILGVFSTREQATLCVTLHKINHNEDPSIDLEYIDIEEHEVQ